MNCYFMMAKYTIEEKIRIVNCYLKIKNFRKVEYLTDIPKSNIHRWYHKYKNLFENNKRVNLIIKKVTNKKTNSKNNMSIINFIKRSLKHQPFQTLKILQNKIKQKYKTIISICNIGCYIKLLNMTKKKTTLKFYYGPYDDHKNKKQNFVENIKTINTDDIICIDETYFNNNIYSKYGYNLKGQRLTVNVNLKKFLKKKTLLMAISKYKIVNYKIYQEKGINKVIFYDYMNELIRTNNISGKIFLMDNVSFHKTNELRNLMTETSNRLLFIPPYSPEYNPIEEVFSSLKAYVRNFINPINKRTNIEFLIKKYIRKNNNMSNYYIHSFGK